MKNENIESVQTDVESWVKETQLSADDLDAVIGGVVQAPVQCGGTYCQSTYAGSTK